MVSKIYNSFSQQVVTLIILNQMGYLDIYQKYNQMKASDYDENILQITFLHNHFIITIHLKK